MTTISFYLIHRGVDQNVGAHDYQMVLMWDKFAALRSLSRGRVDTDLLILLAMCMLFTSIACVFFGVMKHNSPPHI